MFDDFSKIFNEAVFLDVRQYEREWCAMFIYIQQELFLSNNIMEVIFVPLK